MVSRDFIEIPSKAIDPYLINRLWTNLLLELRKDGSQGLLSSKILIQTSILDNIHSSFKNASLQGLIQVFFEFPFQKKIKKNISWDIFEFHRVWEPRPSDCTQYTHYRVPTADTETEHPARSRALTKILTTNYCQPFSKFSGSKL